MDFETAKKTLKGHQRHSFEDRLFERFFYYSRKRNGFRKRYSVGTGFGFLPTSYSIEI